MPTEHQSRREILEAIRSLPALAPLLSSHDGKFEHELDLEVVVYGHNYQGKKVGPYVRLLTFLPGEVIVKQGDWGGNTLYIATAGELEVFVESGATGRTRTGTIPAGRPFGEMSVLAGMPRAATVRASATGPARVLEIQRPALRLLRKFEDFGRSLEHSYAHHGRMAAIEQLRIPEELIDALVRESSISSFHVFGMNHLLAREGAPVDSVFLIREGWVSRRSGNGGQDYLGRGYCFGLEGIGRDASWPWSITMMSRAEALAISIDGLRRLPELERAVVNAMSSFAPPELDQAGGPRASSTAKLIRSGLSDGTNLLVMDLGKCVRCGRCSMACHDIHGHSRLTRRGIYVPRSGMRVPDLLAPAVCLHCMDPECLTGCPTGAIARLSHGQVDINRNTCIGCGDCAINCPYGAISLVSRNPPAPGAPAANSIADLVQIRKQPLPPPVEQTEGLVAVKCNLCRGTGLNPEGSATPAYGCEENCPTGALVRLAPRDQLPELRGIEGPAYRAPGAPPAGRNHHRKDPVAFGLRWAGRASVVLVAALGALAWNRFGLDRPILAGLDLRWITGIAGLAGIVITMLYPHRRRIFRRRAGPLRYWVLVHRYAGFAGAAAIFIHAGSARGGSLLTQGLMLSFDAVILTGIWGLLSYWLGPRHLARLEDGPMLFDDLLRRRAELRSDLAAFLAGSADAAALRSLVARFSSLRAVAGDMVAMVPLAEAIRAETARRPPGHAPAVEAAVALRRIEGLLLIHRMMLSWLPPHVVFTSLMLGMLVIHIFQVIYAAG